MAFLAAEALEAMAPSLEGAVARAVPSLEGAVARSAPSLESNSSMLNQVLPMMMPQGPYQSYSGAPSQAQPVQRMQAPGGIQARLNQLQAVQKHPVGNALIWIGGVVLLALVATVAAFLIMNGQKANGGGGGSVPMGPGSVAAEAEDEERR